jgi:hypothetical protein
MGEDMTANTVFAYRLQPSKTLGKRRAHARVHPHADRPYPVTPEAPVSGHCADTRSKLG